MFVVGNAVGALATLVSMVAQLYVFVMIGRVICSWVNADPYNPIVRFIMAVTEPVLGWIRRVVPPIAGLDFAPLIAILILQVLVQNFLVDTLRDLSLRLG